MGRGQRGPVFFRIVSYFLLLIVPTVVVGIATYILSIRRIRAEFAERAQLSLEAAVESVDDAVQRAQELAVNLFRDRFLRSIVRPTNELTVEQRSELAGVLETLARQRAIAGAAVHNVFLYVDDVSVYGPIGADRFEWFFSRFYVHDRLPAETWKSFLRYPEGTLVLEVTTVRVAFEASSELVLPVVSVGLLAGNKAVAVVTVAMTFVAEALESRKPVDSAFYDVYDENGTRILQAGLAVRDGLQRESQVSTLSRRSPVLGWEYRMSIPEGEIRAYSAGILRVTVFLSVVIITIGVLASLALAARLYAPIRGIRDSLGTFVRDAWSRDATGTEDDFQLIRAAVSRLIDTSTMTHREDSLSELLWYLLEKERIIDCETLRSVAEAAGFEYTTFVVASFQIDGETGPESESVVRDAARPILETWQRHGSLQPLYAPEGYAAVIVSVARDSQRDQLIEQARGIAERIRRASPHRRVVLGIGGTVSSLQSVSRSHSQALAFVRRGLRDGRCLVSAPTPRDVFHFPLDVERSLLELAHQGAIARIRAGVRGIVEYNLSNDISQVALCALMQEIAFAASRGWEEHTGGQEPLDKALFQRATSVECRPEGYRSALRAAIALWGQIAEHWNQGGGPNGDALLSRVSRYVEAHYGDPTLCVRQIGEALGFSEKYVSRRFADQSGRRLSDYVRQVRVRKAKELLRAERVTRIEEVAAAVGISSRATFVRVFKREEGIAPSEYRALASISREERGVKET